MFSSTFTLFAFSSLAFATPLLTPRASQNEHVILANCLDASGHRVSEMAYFSAVPSSSLTPTVAYVNTPANTFATWEGTQVSTTFPDGDTFTSNLLQVSTVGAYAGPASNSYGPFNCFYNPIPNLFIDGPGTPLPLKCSQVYDCSHAPVAAPKPTVEYFFTSDVAAFDAGVIARTFFEPIFQHMSVTACDGNKVIIPNTGDLPTGAADCYIVFTCAGGPSGKILNSLATALVEVVSTLPSVLTTKTVSITPYCLKYAPNVGLAGGSGSFGTQCIEMSGNTKQVSYIQSHMSMDIINYSEGGNLEYQITCPAPPKCKFCDQTAAELDVVSKFPVIGGIFGGIGEVVNYASCKNGDCPEPL
ncbi:hypothetical protein B0J14DRAFT_638895 [Halenospora varia]|nr:hypothetical protein B0J14DRAFT_638895 [Halenospora varia]